VTILQLLNGSFNLFKMTRGIFETRDSEIMVNCKWLMVREYNLETKEKKPKTGNQDSSVHFLRAFASLRETSMLMAKN